MNQPKKIRKAILPVAGFGTRFLPATKAQPKEMLNIVDKPVIQYLVEEVVAAGIEEIIFVTGRGKRAIEDHFDVSYELEDTLVEKNKHDLLAEVQKISGLAKFSYVRQPLPLGDGHALLQAAHLLNGEPALVIFGDCLYDSEVPAAKQLIDVYNQKGASVIGLSEVPNKEVSKFGVIDGEKISEKTYKISKMV
jgi:UTP--glucose-1-phosphate uridylyltransferase